MAKKLYVGNLSYNTTENQLQTLFGEAGEVVSVNIIQDRMTGRSNGFGFVEMGTDSGAATAIERLNDKEVDGRRLKVAEAKPPRQRDTGYRSRW